MSKYTAFRCPEELLEMAKVRAKKDRRSLSNYLITLIEKDVGPVEDEPPVKAQAKPKSRGGGKARR